MKCVKCADMCQKFQFFVQRFSFSLFRAQEESFWLSSHLPFTKFEKKASVQTWEFSESSTSLVRSHTPPPPYVRTVHCSIGNSIPPFELLRILKGVPPAARPPPRPASSYFSSSPPWRFPSLRILWLGRGGRRTWVSASASCSSPSPHGPIREEKRGRCDGGLGVGRLLTFIAGLLLLPVSGERGGPKFGWGERERGQWIGGSHP